MSLQTVCRLCLSMNTPVRALDDGPLRDVYEKLTDISLITPHRPLVACLLCSCQLRKCHNLMVRSVRADKVLSHILDRGEVVTEDSIAMINWKAYQLKNLLSRTPIELIAIPSSGHNLMKATIKEEPVQSQFKEEIDMDRCVENLKCEESEEEECVDRTTLRKITEDRESGVLIDEQDVKSEELEGAMTFDNEGWTSEQDIDTAVLEDITMDIEKLAHEADRKHEILYEAENVKGEDMMQEVSEAAEDIEGSESEGAAPAVKCKRTHTKTQDRTPGDQDITEKQRDNESTSSNTDVNCWSSQHLRNMYICNDCGDMFDDKQLLTQHIEHHDFDGRKTGEGSAQNCTTSPRKGSLNIQIRIHTKEKPLECAICSQTFANKCSLNGHSRIHAKVKPFECVICQRRFTNKGNLKVHLRIHTKEKPFECTVCQKRFSDGSNMKKHLRIHTKEKPLECAICPQTFAHKCPHTKEKPFECAICHRRFTRRGSLKMHIRIIHTKEIRIHPKEIRIHPKEKPFECAICPQTFAYKCSLKRHSRIHAKEKPFECAICQRRFTDKRNLNVHLRIHTKEKPFECTVCKKRFSDSSNLKKHLRIHTNKNHLNAQYANEHSLRNLC